MTLTELQQKVRQHRDVDLQPLYAEYQAGGGSDDINDFIRHLRDREVIDARILAALHTDGAVEATFLLAANHPESMLAATMAAHASSQGGEDGEHDEHDEGPRYDMLGVLGTGAMGEVQLAQDVMLRRKVAFKRILPAMQDNQQVLSRFLAEMQITSQLDHPFIVPVYGLEVTPDGSVAYAMKLVKGKEFADVLSETRQLIEAGKPLDDEHSLDARLEILVRVCDAIDFAHDKGIVHRDLKPANLMIGEHNEVFVMDWGIARPMGEGGAAADAGLELYDAEGDPLDTERTRIGAVLGTPIYMSPEQAAGRNADLDGRSDLYSLGLILQEVVTLTRAVGGTTLQEVITNARGGIREAPRPIERAGVVPPEIDAIISKATKLRPEDRYPTVGAFAQDLRRYLRNEETTALPDNAVRKVGRWISDHRMASLSLMLVLLLAGAGATIGLLIHNQQLAAAHYNRELRLSEFETASAIHAHSVDQLMQRYERDLMHLVGASQRALSHPPEEAPMVHFEADFTGDQPPADLAPSKRYGKPVSTTAAIFSLAPGTNQEDVAGSLGALAELENVLTEVMLDSAGVNMHKLLPEKRREVLATVGVPVHRAHLSLGDGVYLAFPGMLGAGKDYDARKQPAYQLAANKHGIHWGEPTMNKSVGGMIMTCSAPLYDAAHQFRGVASFDIDIARMGDELDLGLDYVDLTMLVARDGTVMAASGDQASTVSVGKPLAIPALTDAMAEGKAGNTQTVFGNRQVLISYYPLHSVQWYFVAVANLDVMMTTETEVAPAAPWAGPPPKPIAKPQAPPPPAPAASEQAEEDAGAGGADAGAGGADAGAEAPPANSLAGPMPTAPWGGVGPSATASAPTPPDAKSAIPKNPFNKWDAYKEGQKEGKPPEKK